MQLKFCVLLALCSGSAIYAQNEKVEAVQQVERPQAYVRRVSLGATLSVAGLSLIPNRDLNLVTTTPAVDTLYTTTEASQRIGYGVTAQLATTEHTAVTASLIVRRPGYQMITDIFAGTDNTSTVDDERVHTVIHQDTRARYLDLPVAIRYYGKRRHDPGHRWFLEAGGAIRWVSHIRTSTDTTVGSAAMTYNFTPVTPARRTLRGFLVGAGLQLIDPLGIRVVPEVRYTRWAGQTFDSFSTATRRNQVEGMISLTF